MMGTAYELYKDSPFGELTIDEMSNKLTFDFVAENHNGFSHCSKQMSPEEMAKVFLKGLTVCSYWMDAGDLKSLVVEHLDEIIG